MQGAHRVEGSPEPYDLRRVGELDRMVEFALNHMTVPRASYATLVDIAARLGCVGVEVRK